VALDRRSPPLRPKGWERSNSYWCGDGMVNPRAQAEAYATQADRLGGVRFGFVQGKKAALLVLAEGREMRGGSGRWLIRYLRIG
jgi:hypothetical protein